MRNGRFAHRFIKSSKAIKLNRNLIIFSHFPLQFSVPQWASDCMIRALPSLTIQYMSDSATVELTRDCGLEGIKRLTCSGKQDQDLLQRELMCISERETNNNENQLKDSIDEHLSDSFDQNASDNTESNHVVNQIEASVEKPFNKFNLNDIMLGDEPILPVTEEIISAKPMKATKKIAIDKPIKNQPKILKKIKQNVDLNKDDLMFGDQPVEYTPNGEEILPHNKKILKEDLKKPEEFKSSTDASEMLTFKNVSNKKKSINTATAAITITSVPTKKQESTSMSTITRSRRGSDRITTQIVSSSTEPSLKLNSDHAKQNHNSTSALDHFVPPMLLVHHENYTIKPLTKENIGENVTLSTETSHHDNQNEQSTVPIISIVNSNDNEGTSNAEIAQSNTTSTVSSILTSDITSTPTTTTTHVQVSNEQHPKTSGMMRPHAPKFGGEIQFHAPVHATSNPDSTTSKFHVIQGAPKFQTIHIENEADFNKTSNETTSSNPISGDSTEPTTAPTHTTTSNIPTENPYVDHMHEKRSSALTLFDDKQQYKGDDEILFKKTADFTNSNDDFQRYKPNRRRILTKPESHTYIQKLFGR